MTRLTEADLGTLLGHAGPSGPCPGADALARLVSGEVDDATRLVLVDHVATCSACQADVRAALGTAEWAKAAAAALVDPATVRLSDPRGSSRHLGRHWIGIAAGLAMLASGAVGWSVWLAQDRAQIARDLRAVQDQVARLSALETQLADAAGKLAAVEAERRMTLNTPIVDLVPSDTRGESRKTSVTLGPGASLVTVIVAVPVGTPAGTPLAIEILDRTGASLGRWSGLRVSALGTSTFTVAASALTTGSLRFRVTRDAAPVRLVHEYHLEVVR